MPFWSASSVSDHMPAQSAATPGTHADSTRIKISLVTSFPPSRGDLNEYGYHLARALRDDRRVELVILADEAHLQEEVAGFCVERCWRFNSVFNPVRLLLAIWKTNPDVVWFNIGFSTFARRPMAAFLGITVPALARALGVYTHVTLHAVMERTNLRDAGLRLPSLYRAAGRIATHLLLLADDVSVLLPSLQAELVNRYGSSAQRVQVHPHGTFEAAPIARLVKPSQSEHIILAFGYWGTYKKLELVLEAMEEIVSKVPDSILVVAGMNHPSTPGYLESLQKRLLNHDMVRFLGYVAENDLPSLFASATVMVLPYSSAAGTSGVVHQACQYGLPMVAAEIPEMVEIVQAEGIAIEFYTQGDSRGLARRVIRLLRSAELRRRMSEQNLFAAQRMPMSQVAAEYVRLFQERIPACKK